MIMKGCLSRSLAGFLLGLVHQVAFAGTVTYVHTDLQGTPVMESDAQGHITARYDYTPYGVPVQGLSGSPNGPGYTGHVNDPDTGFVYMQARYYDPMVGQFLSVDPVGLGAANGYVFNRYAYINNNPYAGTDPSGAYPKGMTADQMNCEIYHCSIVGGDAARAERARSASYRANRALSEAGVLGKIFSGSGAEDKLALAWAAAIVPLKLQVEVQSNIMLLKDKGYMCSPAYSTGDWTTVNMEDLSESEDVYSSAKRAEIHWHPINGPFSGTTAYTLPGERVAHSSGAHGFGDLPRYFQMAIDGYVAMPNGAVYGWKYEPFRNSLELHGGYRVLGDGVYKVGDGK
jgi:RHS repeat-associated protein